MTPAVTQQQTRYVLERFDLRHAAQIAQWVETEEQLRWVAPSSRPPLTTEKVATWPRPGGRAFSLVPRGAVDPVGYGELNPVRNAPDTLWLGHLIVTPEQRGRGIGQLLVRGLLGEAFERLSAERALLVVFPDNEVAIRCYRRVGFRIVGEECHRFGNTGPRHRLYRLEIEAGAFRRRPRASVAHEG